MGDVKVGIYYYRNALDKHHEYFLDFNISLLTSVWFLNLAFYLGRYLKDKKGRKVYLWKLSKAKKIAEYKGDNAERVAKFVAKRIDKHFKEIMRKRVK